MARRGAWRLPPTAAIVAGVVSAGLVAVLALGSVSLDRAHAAGGPPNIVWRSCGTRLQCGRVRVPLDWARPHGPTISLAVIRYVPRGLKDRIGSLFVNFGGPGVAGVATLKGAPEAELEALSERRFDVVSWDPRGTGESTHVRCFGSQRAQTRFWGPDWSIPTTNAESQRYIVKAAAFVKRCVRLSGRLLAHESTADTVHDLDYLRRLVGDRELTYLGVSYGTFIGQTYANLFPRRVRAIVLDGVVNPVAFTTSVRASTSNSVGSSDLVFAKFQSLCEHAGPARCALAGHGSVAARVSALLARIRRGPIPAPSAAPPHRLSYGDLLIALYGRLGNPALWPQLAADLEQAARGDGSSLEEDVQKAAPSYQSTLVSATALQCADKPPPRQGPQAWPSVIGGLTRISRISGPLQGWWLWVPCASWPVASAHRYTGPWTASTRHPILVIGTRLDPQTPFANARRVAGLLGHAVLLTYDGYGHTSENDPSSCVTLAISNYFVRLAAPRRGSICRPDHPPFGGDAHPAARFLGAPSARASSAPTDYRGVITKLNAEVPQLMKAGGTVGLTITLVDGDRTVWRHGFGWADRARKVPVTANTLFHIGSVSKTMSAAAVMQLVQRGLVKLDAPLARYVPGFSLKARFHNSVITVRSALDHHSGIPGTLGNGLFTRTRPYSGYRAWLLKTLRTEYPQRPVNTAWAYNNSAFTLTQNLVEHVTGQGFAAYARRHLFGPMRMRSTTYDDASVPAARLTHNYEAVPDDGALRAIPKPREYVNGWAAGSVISSATDMAAYLKTMIAGGAAPGGRILRASTLRQMITPQTNLPLDIAPFRMGLGWWVGDSALSWMGNVIHHAGHTLSNDSEAMWLPRSKLGVFVSVNTHSPVAVEHQVAVLALGLMVTAKTGRTAPDPPAPSQPIHVSNAVLRRAAGRYASAGGVDSVQVDGAGLVFTRGAQRDGAPSFALTPRADGWYTDATGSLSIKPTTVSRRRLLLGRTSDGAVAAIAERIPSTYHVPAAWRRRTGHYRAVDTRANNYPGVVAHDADLTLDHGLLIWHAAPGVSRETSVLAPAGPRLAFTFGFAPFAVETDAGDGLAAGKNTLTILGVTYRRAGG